MTVAIIILSVLALAGLMAALIVHNLTQICQPNEVLIFSGTSQRVGDRHVGYRLVHGGRAMRIPLIEKVDRLDLTNMVIDLQVNNAYSKGGIPLHVQGVANVKVASEEPIVGNAIERFLDVSRSQIMRVAKETLEGNLRGVLATLTPQEVNHDRIKFASSLLSEADADLSRLGLSLDMLKIQNVSDDVGYLDSIGRRQTAELQMRSRIAEAENQAEAAIRSAENLQTQQIARIEAQMQVASADAERRVLDAQTLKAALVAEQKADVAAKVARAVAELDVQRERVAQVKLQLLADAIRPAEARRDAMMAAAKGAAAPIVEDGRATAGAIRQLAETWRAAGDSAREIVMAQKLTGLVGQLMDTAGDLAVDKVTVIDSQLTNEGAGRNLAVNAAVASEQLKHSLGVDVPALLQRLVPEA